MTTTAVKSRPAVSQSMIDAAAEANVPPPDPDAVALRMQGAQVVLAEDSAARAGAMGIYPEVEQNRVLRDAGYVQMGLDPSDPSNELTDPEVPGTPPPEGNGGEGEGEGGEATEAPVNVDVPHLQQEGDTLHVTMGNWQGEPTSYSYAWQMDTMGIGTDDAFYVVQPGDVGGVATCTVTATNAHGSTTAPPSNAVTVA